METECDMACVPSIIIGLNFPLYKISSGILEYFLQFFFSSLLVPLRGVGVGVGVSHSRARVFLL